MDEFCTLLDSKKDDYFLLDVRKAEEIRKQSGIAGSRHIPVTQLLDNLSEIPRDKNVVPLCPSGNRAMLAASLLKREGWAQVSVPVGGKGAWKASKCASG
jgi:hydroxyacylglutathione hydrolase